MKTGKANYEKTQYKKKNRFNQEDGDVIFRILPPLGDLADKGIWSRFHSVHFGYKNTEGKLRPFTSPLVKNNKTREVEVRDAALDRLNDLKTKLDQAKIEGNAPLVARLNVLVGPNKAIYNIDNGHHMNVIDLQGNIGTLKIRHKAKILLDAEIKKLRDEGVDPLSLEDGRFFIFTRNGRSNETSFKVSVYTEKLDIAGVGKVERPVVHKLTPDILARLETEASDLDTLFSKVTAEECAQIVNASDLQTGKSPACDLIFDARWKAKRGQDSQDDVQDPNEPSSNALSGSSGSIAATQTTPTVNTALTPPPAAVKTTPQPLSAATTKAAAKPQSEAIDQMSDEDFWAACGVKPNEMPGATG